MQPWRLGVKDSIGKELSDFRERALEVASTCATDFEATSALPRSVLEPQWSADFESFCWQSIPLIDPARFSLDHFIRPSCEGLHAQIEVHVDHASGQKVVAKRFTRAYLRDSPRAFRESDAFCGEDPWTEMFLAMKLGQAGPDRIKGVLPCYGVYRDASDSALLIMEWASAGDVFEYASSLGEPGPAREAQDIAGRERGGGGCASRFRHGNSRHRSVFGDWCTREADVPSSGDAPRRRALRCASSRPLRLWSGWVCSGNRELPLAEHRWRLQGLLLRPEERSSEVFREALDRCGLLEGPGLANPLSRLSGSFSRTFGT